MGRKNVRFYRIKEAISQIRGARHGCTVCWTCNFFNCCAFECNLTYDNIVEITGAEPDRERGYFKKTKIEEPNHYWCLAWQEKNL